MTDHDDQQDQQIQADLRTRNAEMTADGVPLDPASAAYNHAAWPAVIPPPEIEPEPEPEAG